MNRILKSIPDRWGVLFYVDKCYGIADNEDTKVIIIERHVTRMILSVSRRTDIPCFYGEWFMNRLRAGFVLVRNPMNFSQIGRVPVTPDVVDGIVFWTKNPLSMMEHWTQIRDMGYPFYVQFTVTPYGRKLERNLPDKNVIMDTFCRISDQIGKERMIWRYDPIILNDELTIGFHEEMFGSMCERLAGSTNRVHFSFVDLYKKVKTDQIRLVGMGEMRALAGFIGKEAAVHGLRAMACCEEEIAGVSGIRPAACIDQKLLEEIIGCSLKLKPDSSQRKGCHCCESIDIGAYQSCMNGCVYCYANHGLPDAKRIREMHDPKGEMLIGELLPGEKVSLRKVSSNRDGQTKFSLDNGFEI